MPISNRRLIEAAAEFKRLASAEFDKAVKKLIDLVWSKGKPTADFLFESDPELDSEANEVLQGLSDALAAKAKRIAEAIIRDQLNGYGEEAWDETNNPEGDVSIVFRFDMQGSHLKELLEIWIALAVVNGIRRSELNVLVSRYVRNPFASPLWRNIPTKSLKWGRGYSKDILDQIAIIGQNGIIEAVRHAEWQEQKDNGAEYYIRRRGSNYDCDVCQEMANKPIPIDTPFEIPHSRCCCYPEYFFDKIP